MVLRPQERAEAEPRGRVDRRVALGAAAARRAPVLVVPAAPPREVRPPTPATREVLVAMLQYPAEGAAEVEERPAAPGRVEEGAAAAEERAERPAEDRRPRMAPLEQMRARAALPEKQGREAAPGKREQQAAGEVRASPVTVAFRRAAPAGQRSMPKA